MKVWVVTSGEYSDYGIEAIFSTKELADALASKSSEYNEVDEWEVDALRSVAERTGKCYSVYLTPRGDLLPDYGIREENPKEDVGLTVSWGWGSDKTKIVVLHVWAEDEQHAIKIANERRVKFLIEEEAKP